MSLVGCTLFVALCVLGVDGVLGDVVWSLCRGLLLSLLLALLVVGCWLSFVVVVCYCFRCCVFLVRCWWLAPFMFHGWTLLVVVFSCVVCRWLVLVVVVVVLCCVVVGY